MRKFGILLLTPFLCLATTSAYFDFQSTPMEAFSTIFGITLTQANKEAIQYTNSVFFSPISPTNASNTLQRKDPKLRSNSKRIISEKPKALKVTFQPLPEQKNIPRTGPKKVRKKFKKRPVTTSITKITYEKPQKKHTRIDRYLDFVVPASITQSILDPAQRRIHGTFVGQGLQEINHAVSEPVLNQQGINELIGVGLSNFSGSSHSRRHNIFNAIKKFDGQIVKQGEEFSFNNILDNAGPDNGFVLSKVIIRGMTKWGWGGGVCQVSTTLFRSAYNAGLPISARRNHSFQVPYYKPQGFDATIYLGGQDLKFINTTPGDIMMQFVVDGDNLITLLYGTRDRSTVVNGPWKKGLSYSWKRTITPNFSTEAKEEWLHSYYKPEVFSVASEN